MNRRCAITDAEILARARTIFVERGYAARTKQIAAAVGLTWGAIALRFGSKQALFSRAMAEPGRGPGEAGCEHAGEADLAELLERLRNHLWQRWPQRLQVRVAATANGPVDEEQGLKRRLAEALETHASRGAVRKDIGAEPLARVVLALFTGDVARRFVAREPILTPDPALIGGVVRLLGPG